MSKTPKQDPKFRAARKATTGKRKPAADYFGRYWSDTERMKPTNYFAWFSATRDEEETPCTTEHCSYNPSAYVLKQWWADDVKGEWRIVPTPWHEGPPTDWLHEKGLSVLP